jgi:hypothetical protein
LKLKFLTVYYYITYQKLDSKGIRQGAEEKSPMKILNSFALAVNKEKPLLTFEISIWGKLILDAWPVSVSFKGGVTFRAIINW